MVIATTPPPCSLANLEGVFYVVSHGMNSYSTPHHQGRTTHAEHAAMKRLPNRKHKSVKKVNLLVVRTSQTGVLGSSKPCLKCILDMQSFAPQKGYKIDTVYYTDETGSIQGKKLSQMITEGNFHVSAYYKNHNFKNPYM